MCDGYIEHLRQSVPLVRIEPYIKRHDERNKDNLITNVKGVSVYKRFREPTSKVNRNELSNYKIVKPRQLSFVQTTHNEKVFAYALNDTDEDIVVSSVNEVFSTDKEKLLPEFLALCFNRKEFDRYARYHSWGSAREVFAWADLCDVKIPLPELSVQQAVADIYQVWIARRQIAERLKQQINQICPVLVRGAAAEAV